MICVISQNLQSLGNSADLKFTQEHDFSTQFQILLAIKHASTQPRPDAALVAGSNQPVAIT